jgi:hypothetical protein
MDHAAFYRYAIEILIESAHNSLTLTFRFSANLSAPIANEFSTPTQLYRGAFGIVLDTVFCYASTAASIATKPSPLRRMKYLALFVAVSMTTAATSQATDNTRRWTIDRPDRTITWRPWHRNSQFEYRFRTGDRYLGHVMWEHYLCFGETRFSDKTIKLFMIRLANQEGLGDVVISPRLRYAILKITNNKMTAHEGVWSWIAEEVDYSKVKSIQRLRAIIHRLLSR